MNRTCIRCGKPKDLDTQFSSRGSYDRDGNLRRHSWCKSCHKSYMKDYYPENKNQYLKNMREYRQTRQVLIDRLKDRPCQDCGLRFPVVCMQFDHVDGIKEFDVSVGTSRSIERLLEEATKCEIVCANCHCIRTFNRRPNSVKHAHRAQLSKMLGV